MKYQEMYPSVWEKASGRDEIFSFAEGYKDFLNQCKTERDAVSHIRKLLLKNGFLDGNNANQNPLQAGDRLYSCKQNKSMAMLTIGTRPISEGLRIICAHIDSPRLDLRPNPVCGDGDIIRFRTHYYGGIKKYQWVTQPLALHGRAIRAGGEAVDFSLGEKPDEPVFYISDLPKHLSAEQAKKPLGDGICGEELNALAGSGTDAQLLTLLKDRWHLTLQEIATAELSFVPAGQARDVGFDGSLIAAYGQDDKICVYAALQAFFQVPNPVYTTMFVLADKEEVGSVGATGMNTRMLENFAVQLLSRMEDYSAAALRQALERAEFISADVIAGYDSNYPSAFEPGNTARLGHGPVLIKYTGQNGKKGSNAAGAEFLAALRDTFDNAGVCWQVGEMGRIDLGGGGTIAPFAAQYGMSCVDCGPALLSMHAPYELTSKADAYETFRAYRAFFESRQPIGIYL